MPGAKKLSIPFVKQSAPTNCTAACLEMIYRAYGVDRLQDEIFQERWSAMWTNNKLPFMTANAAALDALDQGLSATIVRARDMPQMLRRCSDHGLPAIVIQRSKLSKKFNGGHARVFVEAMSATRFLFRDPTGRANMEMTAFEVREYSKAHLPEVTGECVVAISKANHADGKCSSCQHDIPSKMPCPRCEFLMPFIVPLFGCWGASCGDRLWDAVACPKCDLAFGVA